MATFEWDFSHYSRHVPWGGYTGEGDIIVLGKDWSLAAFVWTFADSQGGTVRVTLSNASAGTQGVSAIYDPDYVDPESGEVTGATIITPLIGEVAFEGLTWGSPATKKTLSHDLIITPPGLQQLAYCWGVMTIEVGVGD